MTYNVFSGTLNLTQSIRELGVLATLVDASDRDQLLMMSRSLITRQAIHMTGHFGDESLQIIDCIGGWRLLVWTVCNSDWPYPTSRSWCIRWPRAWHTSKVRTMFIAILPLEMCFLSMSITPRSATSAWARLLALTTSTTRCELHPLRHFTDLQLAQWRNFKLLLVYHLIGSVLSVSQLNRNNSSSCPENGQHLCHFSWDKNLNYVFSSGGKWHFMTSYCSSLHWHIYDVCLAIFKLLYADIIPVPIIPKIMNYMKNCGSYTENKSFTFFSVM